MHTRFQQGNLAENVYSEDRRKWENNIKMYPQETVCENERWMELPQDCIQCLGVVLAVLFCHGTQEFVACSDSTEQFSCSK
jgi:hypothetical protein